jgi:hypothetical protein
MKRHAILGEDRRCPNAQRNGDAHAAARVLLLREQHRGRRRFCRPPCERIVRARRARACELRRRRQNDERGQAAALRSTARRRPGQLMCSRHCVVPALRIRDTRSILIVEEKIRCLCAGGSRNIVARVGRRISFGSRCWFLRPHGTRSSVWLPDCEGIIATKKNCGPCAIGRFRCMGPAYATASTSSGFPISVPVRVSLRGR